MPYNLYVVAPRPFSDAAFNNALGLDEYLNRPTQAYKDAQARREAQEHGEQAEGQGDVRGDGGSQLPPWEWFPLR